jgi:hypothetical protein
MDDLIPSHMCRSGSSAGRARSRERDRSCPQTPPKMPPGITTDCRIARILLWDAHDDQTEERCSPCNPSIRGIGGEILRLLWFGCHAAPANGDGLRLGSRFPTPRMPSLISSASCSLVSVYSRHPDPTLRADALGVGAAAAAVAIERTGHQACEALLQRRSRELHPPSHRAPTLPASREQSFP